RLGDAFGVELPLPAFFAAPTVAGLAPAVAAARATGGDSGLPPLAPAPRDRPLPLSFAQERIWFLHQLEPHSVAYNIPRALRIEGPLVPRLVARAFTEIFRRHEILRTTFPARDGVPVQAVHPPRPASLPVVDLAGLPARERDAAVRRLILALGQRPFDLERGPLMRLALLRLAAGDHVLVLSEHHLVHDGWTQGVLVGEFLQLYRAFAAGRPSPLPELPIQYGDFASWQRRCLEEEALAPLLAYWRSQLAGLPPVLELPFDRPRAEVQSFRGALREAVLDGEAAEAVRRFGRRRGAATLFMSMLAAFAALLARLSGQELFAIGTGVANRRRPELEGLLGMIINTLVLRGDVSGGPAFGELLRRTREVCLGAYEHQDLPFEKLVDALRPERTLRHMPLFQVMYAFLDTPMEALELPGLRLTLLGAHNRSAKFDLNLTVIAHSEQRSGAARHLTLMLEYATDLFDGTTAERILRQYRSLLEGALGDPETPVWRLPLLGGGERQQLLREWNDTAAVYPREASIAAVFAEQARERPEAPALAWGEEAIGYGELERRANRLAHHLRRLGVGPESVVALALERSPALVVAMLGVLKAGGVYAPLDPASPAERLGWMLEELGAPVVLTDETWAGSLPETAARVVVLEREAKRIAAESALAPEVAVGAQSLAYVMFTSGSTGRPKGVAVPHRAVVRLVRGSDYAAFGPGEVFVQLAPPSFDASTLEIWGALLNGGKLVLPAERLAALPALGELIARHGVTTLWLTAGLFHEVVEEDLGALRPLRQLLAGGDVLAPADVERVRRELPGVRLVNGYGPTENTTFSCCCRLDGAAWECASVPIGRPIANGRALVLDGELEPAGVGVVGELFVGGDGLARAYWGRPERTAERFVPDPFVPGERLYRTGDLARRLADGRLEFVGRRDGQVKVRGYRVELGEVEAALGRCPGVGEAVVVAQGEGAAEKRLVAYVVGQDGAAPAAAELRAFLAGRLPEYMLPSAYVSLEKLPLTANGKVDRRALPASDRAAPEEGFVAPRSEVERLLAGICGELLSVGELGVRDNFFHLGGHSLHVTRLLSRIRRELEVDLPVSEFFKRPTVEGLALAVAAALAADLDGDELSRLVAEVDRGEAAATFAGEQAGG
ncbi:MAG TPA: amino acid adenylation domain-containing protein, partial [Thermoanaerobaculia bacterium]|nr:amino acid adenylation domain-containing protein [Thermoanaerobaculia bacterium]